MVCALLLLLHCAESGYWLLVNNNPLISGRPKWHPYAVWCEATFLFRRPHYRTYVPNSQFEDG